MSTENKTDEVGVSEKFVDGLLEQAKRDGVQKILAGVILERGNDILILRRAPTEDFLKNLWELPSGHVESQEKLITGLYRESTEETGLTPRQIESYIGSFDYRTGSGKLARQFNFAVKHYDGQLKLNPAEHSEYAWVNPANFDFSALTISTETLKIIRHYVASKLAKQ